MADRARAPDPGELLSRFRASYRNYYRTWTAAGSVPEGVELVTPAEHQLDESSLPEGARTLLESYREQIPQPIELVKYLRIVDGEPELVVDDDADLPPEDEMLTLSQTVTLNSAEHVRVITDIFVARLA